MARALRIEVAGGRYHLTSRGNERRSIYRDDQDRMHFLELLKQLPELFGCVVHAYVLMDNHYHLLLETPEPNLSRVGQWLNLSYGVWFNRRHQRVGHLFQGRFKSHLIEDDLGVREVARYLHLNPVRVGRFGLSKSDQARQRSAAAIQTAEKLIQERLQLLREYPWSSYPAYVGTANAASWLTTEVLGGLYDGLSTRKRMEALRRHVEGPIREGVVESPWDRLIGGSVLGSEEYVNQLRRQLKGNRREQPGVKALERKIRWDQIVKSVEAVKGESWERFRDRHGDWGRDAALYLGRHMGRMKLGELATAVGGLDYAVVGTAVSRMKKRMEEGDLKRELRKLKDKLSKFEM